MTMLLLLHADIPAFDLLLLRKNKKKKRSFLNSSGGSRGGGGGGGGSQMFAGEQQQQQQQQRQVWVNLKLKMEAVFVPHVSGRLVIDVTDVNVFDVAAPFRRSTSSASAFPVDATFPVDAAATASTAQSIGMEASAAAVEDKAIRP